MQELLNAIDENDIDKIRLEIDILLDNPRFDKDYGARDVRSILEGIDTDSGELALDYFINNAG